MRYCLRRQVRSERRIDIGLLASLYFISVCLLALVPYNANASDWRPERAVELVVPAGPGGGQDRIARTAQRLIQELNLVDVPINVVNRPGGRQSVAYSYLRQRPGDGHYISLSTLNIVLNRIMGTHPVNYRDITPLSQLSRYYLSYAAKVDSSIASAQDLVKRLKADPQSVSFSSAGGGLATITTGMLATAIGIDPRKMKTVVFRSGGEAMAALLGGHVDLVGASPSGILPHLQSGAARVIGISAPKRLSGAYTDVPTLREQGVEVISTEGYNILGAPGLSPQQIAYWENVFRRLAASPGWKKEVERNVWEDSFLGSAELLRWFQEQDVQITQTLTAMGLAKN